jgi:DNA-binding CsgD family transcriptional regulator/GAF domain-containing protein
MSTRATVARAAIERLCALDLPPLELLTEVARRVRSAVPYDVAGWLLTDPATLLHTAAISEGVPPRLLGNLVDNELTTDDVAKFTAVARAERPVVTLNEATAGDLSRSRRHRTLHAPEGYGDELRAAFRAGGACWGVVCLARTQQEPAFSAAEVAFIAAIAPHVGHGVRSGLLLAACADPSRESPGMVVLDEHGGLEALTGEAERWLAELPGDGIELPLVVHEVARRAQAGAGPRARARVALPSGRWLTVHGARLRGAGGTRTAVMLEPARALDLAPLMFERYELTAREREVTRLLVSGQPTPEIASSLCISPHTLRDHVKAIFAKLGVSSRPELTAMLFYEHFLPGG